MINFSDKTLCVATHNAGKLREIEDLLAPFGFIIKSAADLNLNEPEETGTTFEENAYIKASLAAKAANMPALSDDSGLAVDALGGAPGVYTADWAIQADGSRNFNMAMQKVEDALEEIGATEAAQRKAQFICVLCLALPDGSAQYFRGEIAGTIVKPRGTLGFGYDPLFLPDGYEKTFGEMRADEKHGWKIGDDFALSHRARAFKLFAKSLLADKAVV